MDSIEDPKPIPLEYSERPPPKSSWPVGLYAFALVWALVMMRGYTAATTAYRVESMAALRTQVALLACAALRLAWARHRREQGKRWVFYGRTAVRRAGSLGHGLDAPGFPRTNAVGGRRLIGRQVV